MNTTSFVLVMIGCLACTSAFPFFKRSQLRKHTLERAVTGTVDERCDQLNDVISSFIEAVLDSHDEVAIQSLSAGLMERVDINNPESIREHACGMAAVTNLEEMAEFQGIPEDILREHYSKAMVSMKVMIQKWRKMIDSGETISDPTRAMYNMYVVMQQLGYLDLTR